MRHIKQPTRVIVADDHDCVRMGVRTLLESSPDITVVDEASDAQELADAIWATPCDVIVTDIHMNGVNGESNAVSMLRRMFRYPPHPAVVALTTMHQPRLTAALLHIGVRAIIDKRDAASSLIPAIQQVLRGDGVYLSPSAQQVLDDQESMPLPCTAVLSAREWEIFQLYARGMTVKQIADHLRRSGKTISSQKRTGMRKLGLATEADLIEYARQASVT
jgi:two-component system, NarL family, captular synthesis response regulator RcsB